MKTSDDDGEGDDDRRNFGDLLQHAHRDGPRWEMVRRYGLWRPAWWPSAFLQRRGQPLGRILPGFGVSVKLTAIRQHGLCAFPLTSTHEVVHSSRILTFAPSTDRT